MPVQSTLDTWYCENTANNCVVISADTSVDIGIDTGINLDVDTTVNIAFATAIDLNVYRPSNICINSLTHSARNPTPKLHVHGA